MHTLRAARLITRLVLVAWLLALGAAIASPLLKPQALSLVCSGVGVVKLLPQDDGDAEGMAGQALDCPLCLTPGAPPPVPARAGEPVSPLAHVLRPIPAAHIAWLTAAPLPPRGPPRHS